MLSTSRPVVEFDHHSQTVAHCRDRVLAELRTKPPMFFTESHGGYWVVASHAYANRVLGDPGTFSSARDANGGGGVAIPPIGVIPLLPAECDPPQHDMLRKLLTPLFSRRAVEKLRAEVASVVTKAIDDVVAKQHFDVVHDISDLVPARVIVGYLGFPEAERLSFIESIRMVVTTAVLAPEGQLAQDGMDAFMHASTAILNLMTQRRQSPTDDLTSHLVQSGVLSDDEMLIMIFTLLLGGIDNPAALIANSLLYLSQDRALRSRLIAEPGLIPTAIEELLRFTTSAVTVSRTVTRDVDFDGFALKQGDRVLVWLPAANHDETVFLHPDTVDIDRPLATQQAHISFGHGPHYCLGATLARLEVRLVLSEVLSRIPDYTVDIESGRRFDDIHGMYGWWSLPATTNG